MDKVDDQAAVEARASLPPSSCLRQGWFESMLAETRFLERYPHYAGVLARLDPVASNTVPVMAVCLRRWDDPDSRLQLLVNTAYFERFPQYRAGVLLHEIQHVLLGHLTAAKFHSVSHPRLMELAMEISADELVTEPMPENGLEMRVFSQFGIRRGQSTMERYALLRAACQSGRLKIQEGWFPRMRDTHRPQQEGASGGGAGLGDLIDARSDGASERNWNRKWIGLGRPTSQAALRRMKQAIAAHLRGEHGGADDPLQRKVARRGKELQRLVLESGRRGGLNWPRVLRQAFPRRRIVQPDYLRPNRRFPERVGEIPGRRRRPPKPRLLVGIDTSGSMTGEALDRVAKEIRRLARHGRLTLAECDAVVHRVYPMPERLGPFVGGGDTDFVPVFDEARAARRFEGLVYFTDGKGNQPTVPPAIPTLWVLTNEDPFDPPWGSVVRLPEL
jgi:hypothetical protein